MRYIAVYKLLSRQPIATDYLDGDDPWYLEGNKPPHYPVPAIPNIYDKLEWWHLYPYPIQWQRPDKLYIIID